MRKSVVSGWLLARRARGCQQFQQRRHDSVLMPRTYTHGGSSAFRGVCWNKQAGTWQCQIRNGDRVHHLGYFDLEIEAARAHDAAARNLKGKTAPLNFPNPGDDTSETTKKLLRSAPPVPKKRKTPADRPKPAKRNPPRVRTSSFPAPDGYNGPLRRSSRVPVPRVPTSTKPSLHSDWEEGTTLRVRKTAKFPVAGGSQLREPATAPPSYPPAQSVRGGMIESVRADEASQDAARERDDLKDLLEGKKQLGGGGIAWLRAQRTTSVWDDMADRLPGDQHQLPESASHTVDVGQPGSPLLVSACVAIAL